MEDKSKVQPGQGGQDRPEIDLAPHHEHQMIPVWFFVGLILFIYGIIITAWNSRALQASARSAGEYATHHAPSRGVVGSVADRHRRLLHYCL